jgi:hypothetical protein
MNPAKDIDDAISDIQRSLCTLRSQVKDFAPVPQDIASTILRRACQDIKEALNDSIESVEFCVENKLSITKALEEGKLQGLKYTVVTLENIAARFNWSIENEEVNKDGQ